MKKTFRLSVALVFTALLTISCLSVSAASMDANKKKVLDVLEASVTVDSKTVVLPADFVNQAKNYLRRDDVVLTEAQANTVAKEIDNAVTLVKDAGVTSLDKLSSADKSEILTSVKKAAEAANLSVMINASGSTITIKDKAGNPVAQIGTSIIKKTGADSTALVTVTVLSAILLAGCVVIARKEKLGA